MEFTIHLYGYAYHMFNTLNAIAMFRNSSLYPAAINTMALMVAAYYSLRMAGARAEGEWRQYLIKVAGMILVINALLLPKTSVNIKDHVEKHFWRVDNIPLAFALPIGMVEQMGHLITIGFEQAFSAVDGRSAFNYYHHGTAFGARLAKEVMHVHVRNPEFTSNMKGFIERCVIMPAMIGQQFTKEELVATKDMWGLVSDNAGTFTRTPMTIDGVRQVPSPTCRQAVPYFEKKMAMSARADITGMSIKLRAPGADAGYNPSHLNMNAALTNQISALYDNDASVADILKHNMMINSLNNYRAAKYPAVKAQLQHEATGLLSGDMAERVLTGYYAVFKNLIYGSFIFVMPLMLLAGGMGKYRGWITICLSLQLWPPLFAMLNMMVDTAYDPAHIVSYSAWATEVKRMDSIASTAANLTLLIPILAVYVTRMGEGGFLHIAGSLMSANQSAVAAGAAEQASGGRNYDNESINNSNQNNVNENKYDNTRQYVSGTNSGINPDGSMEKILPNGNVITVAGAGTTSSVGEASYRASEGISTSLHEGRREEIQMMNSEMASLSKAKESLISQEASAMTTIAENTRTDKGYDIDTSTDEGKAFVKSLNTIDRMTEGNDYTWQQNAEAYLKTEVSPPIAGKIASFLGFSASAGGEVRASNGSQQHNGVSSEVSEGADTSNSNSINTRSNKRSAWMESKGVDKNQQSSMRETHNESTRLEKSITTHKDNIEGYNKAIDHVENHNAEYSKDMTQDVINAYKAHYGVSDREASKAVLDGKDSAQKLFRQISGAKANNILQQVRTTGAELNTSNNVSDFINKNQDAVQNNVGSDGGAVSKFASDQGMTGADVVTNNINKTGDELKTAHERKLEEKTSGYKDAQITNAKTREERGGEIKKLEDDRIGKGRVSKAIAVIGDKVTLGNSGSSIGRPSPESPQNKEDLGPKVVRPETDFTSADISDAREVINEFNPDGKNDDDTSLAKGVNEYVDPSKNTKKG